MHDKEKIEKALAVIASYGGIYGSHHRAWVLDQVVQLLAGDNYEQWVIDVKDGEDGPETYSHDKGIAP